MERGGDEQGRRQRNGAPPHRLGDDRRREIPRGDLQPVSQRRRHRHATTRVSRRETSSSRRRRLLRYSPVHATGTASCGSRESSELIGAGEGDLKLLVEEELALRAPTLCEMFQQCDKINYSYSMNRLNLLAFRDFFARKYHAVQYIFLRWSMHMYVCKM